MTYLSWLLKAAIFFTLFAFALNNQHAVSVHFFFGHYWKGPLVLMVLAAFVLGLVAGVLGMVAHRKRRPASPAQPSPAAPPEPAAAATTAPTVPTTLPENFHGI